jgi:xanthine dehydrogenase YagR molybdenum-binding subunit
MAQMVAQTLGIAIERVEVVIGDSSLPSGAISGGSMLTASLVAPIEGAIAAAGKALVSAAVAGQSSPFTGVKADELGFSRGRIEAKNGNRRTMAFDEVLRALKIKAVSGEGSGEGTFGVEGKPKFSSHSFGAHFVEVSWQPEIARLRVSRAVSVFDAGRILNPLMARNQIEGAIVMGIGMALFEGTDYEAGSGKPVNANFADYVVATNADVPELDVHFIEYPDFNLNTLRAAWAKSDWPAPRRPSPTRFIMQPACASASCRSGSNTSFERARRKFANSRSAAELDLPWYFTLLPVAGLAVTPQLMIRALGAHCQIHSASRPRH